MIKMLVISHHHFKLYTEHECYIMGSLVFSSSQVVRALDSMDEFSDLTNGTKPGQSEVFDSAQHSAQIRMFQRMAFGSQEYSSEFFNQSQSSSRSYPRMPF